MKDGSRNLSIIVVQLVLASLVPFAILVLSKEPALAQAPVVDTTTTGTSTTINQKEIEKLPPTMRRYQELLKLNPQQRKGTINDPVVEKGKYPGGRRETYDSSISNETTVTEYDKDKNVVERTEISRYPNGKPRRISTTVYYTDAKRETGSPQEKTETSAIFDDRGNVTGTTKREKDKNGNSISDKADEWKYDEQGRQTEHTVKEDDPKGFSKGSKGTREITKYSGDNDKKGTTTKEKLRRNEQTGAWETEFGIPLEKLKHQQAETPAREPQSLPGPGEQTGEIMVSYPSVELFGGYSLTSEDGDSENTNLHGWNTSVAVNLNEHLAVRADVSGFYRSDGNTDISKHLFVFGPQFSYRPNSKVRLFARPLFGFAHFKSETELPGLPSPIRFSQNAFAMAFGGGVDLRVNSHLIVRLGQFDYQPTFFGETRQDNFRFSTGLVFTFGRGGGKTNNRGDDSPPFAPGTLAQAAPADVKLSRWKFVEQGGNLNQGIIRNVGQCPCGHDYTVNSESTYTNVNARPGAAQFQACLAKPPAHREPSEKCKGDCVQVKTHQWHGYRVLQDTVTRQWVLTCYTLAQFHCKKPNDPDTKKAPREIDPRSERDKKKPDVEP